MKKNNEIRLKIFIYILIFLVIVIFEIIRYNYLINPPNNMVYFVDVGQGDASLIKLRSGKNIVIDTGEGESSRYPTGKKVFFPYLLKRNVKKIDYLIISHFDSDHSGGSKTLIENLEVENILITEQAYYSKQYIIFMKEIIKKQKEYNKYNKGKNINIIYAKEGDRINIDKQTKIDIYSPSKNNDLKGLNNNSLVALITIGKSRILYTGDIESEAEKRIQKKLKGINVDILKVPHHGSNTSTTKGLLESINTKEAVISVGKNNTFNHPSKLVLRRLKERKINIRRTDKEGEIEYKFP